MPYDYGDVSPTTVERETAMAIEEADALVAVSVASVDAPSYGATLRPVDLAWGRIASAYGRGAFLGQVSTDEATRAAAHVAEERLTKWRVGLAFREDLHAAIAAFAATDEAAALDGERERLLEFWMRDFRRAGHELDATARDEIERLRARLVELAVAFQRNVNESNDWIEVGPAQLDGLPLAYVERLARGDGSDTWRVSLDTPEILPFLEQSTDREARAELFRRQWSRAAEANRPLIEEAIRLRHRIAELHGQPSWAHFSMEVRMAGVPARVQAFYDEIVPAVAGAAGREVAAMEQMLAADGAPGRVGPEDWRYCDFEQRIARFGVDQQAVSEHLPLDAVLDGLFAITGEVFGLRYRKLPEAHAWHPSVTLYEIRDAETDLPLAHFYADLFPRPGKFNHAAAFPLTVGHRRADGSYERPITAIVANLTPPAGDRPSLLRHDDVETLFHEFGHVLHMSLTRTEAARFSGAETEWDFVEAPSQIMEHWIWEPDVLRRFARHYRTGAPIPVDLVERLAAARTLNAGLRAAIQVFYGTLDLAIHGGDSDPDLDAILRATFEVTGLPYPDGTFLLGSFGHLMNGYDAGYYGYLWAEALGDDMWTRFEREGILSPDVGRDYRRTVLEPNGSRSGDAMFADFVGREPSTDAWLRTKGLIRENATVG